MTDINALKELLQPFMPLLGVVVGALVTGFGNLYKAHVARKKLIAQALSDLLEVRHRVVMMNEVMKKLQTAAVLPGASIPHLRNVFDQCFPMDPKLDERFNEAVTLLAGVDPVLAFNLRSKNLAPVLLKNVRAIAAQTEPDLAGYESVERHLIDAMEPSINSAVLSMAKEHSFKVHAQVKAIISDKDSLSDEMGTFFASMGIELPVKTEAAH